MKVDFFGAAFIVSGLPVAGQKNRIVFPQRRPIPSDAIYRKNNAASGWHTFVKDIAHAVALTQFLAR